MRAYLSFFVIAVMTMGVLFLTLTKVRPTYEAPAEILPPVEADGGSANNVHDAQVLVDGGAALDAGVDAESAPPAKASRPLRVTALGWELVAEGVAVTDDPASNDGLTIELAPEATASAVEARLGRGGPDPEGADVAVMPLPTFVLAYEKLRALEPRVFAITGWSHGREEFHAARGAWPKVAGPDVKLATTERAVRSEQGPEPVGTDGATLFGLFALDLAGISPAHVERVELAGDGVKAPFSAFMKGTPDDRPLALSTSDAANFLPLVAVAPRAVLDAHADLLGAFVRRWNRGQEIVRRDASLVARRMTHKEELHLSAGVSMGPPDVLSIVERLGQIQPLPLDQQRGWLDAGARPGSRQISLATLMQRTWQLARAARLTTMGAPEPLPIDARIVDAVAPAPVDSTNAHAADADADAGAWATVPAKATVLVIDRVIDPQATVESVGNELSFLATVFDRATFRVTAKGGEKAALAAVGLAVERFGVPRDRLATTQREPSDNAFASIEVLTLP